jgi:hypothetical protein
MRKKLSLFIILALFSSCTIWRPFNHPESARLPESYEHYYDYPQKPFAPQVISEEKTRSYVMRRFEIPLHLPEELMPKDLEKLKKETDELATHDQKTANDIKLRYLNRIDYYVPKNLKPGEKRPVILISPILGGNMVVDHFAKYYVGRGYVAAIVHRKKKFFNSENEEVQQIENYLRTSIIRLRQSVDWLEQQPEVDPNRIGAFGISYGAIMHTVLAAVEPRIRYHVLAMAAGPIADVIIECPDGALKKLVTQLQDEKGWSREKVHAELKKTIKTDPMYLAPYVPREKVQMYIAIFDGVIGVDRSFNLWRALRKPPLKILPFGHYGGILVFPYLETQSYWTLKKHLKK